MEEEKEEGRGTLRNFSPSDIATSLADRIINWPKSALAGRGAARRRKVGRATAQKVPLAGVT